jgi:hypothetical protein
MLHASVNPPFFLLGALLQLCTPQSVYSPVDGHMGYFTLDLLPVNLPEQVFV